MKVVHIDINGSDYTFDAWEPVDVMDTETGEIDKMPALKAFKIPNIKGISMFRMSGFS